MEHNCSCNDLSKDVHLAACISSSVISSRSSNACKHKSRKPAGFQIHPVICPVHKEPDEFNNRIFEVC